jgi:biopolymer transport protein ExbD/biopolymer transport protein TolR
MAFTDPDGRTQTTLSEINVTPLVDVMLVLLIIFMVTAPILQMGIQVSLPRTQKVEPTKPRFDAVIVTIDKNSNIYLGTGRSASNRKVNITELPGLLKEKIEQSKERKVYVRGDGDAPYRTVAYVLSLCKASTASVSLITDVDHLEERK